MSDFINTIDIIGDDALIESIIEKTIIEFKDDTVGYIGSYAFYGCYALSYVDCPTARNISAYAFARCSSLTTVSFPAATAIYTSAFMNCSSLTTVSFPAAKYISARAFTNCSSLTTVSFPAVITIYSSVFSGCSNLTALILTSSSTARLNGNGVFNNTPIARGTGYVYVPSSLVATYQAASNWSTYAAQISAIEDSEFN